MKIIQISSASSSYSVKDYEKDFFLAWYARVGFAIKKYHKELNVECWTIEKECKDEKEIEKEGVKFRIFPTKISLRHGMEISFNLLKAIKEEIKKAKKENERLVLHLHEYHSWITYLILFLTKKDNVKIIAQHHGGRNPFANLKKYKILFLVFPLIALMQFCENFLFKKIDIVYALSEEEMEYLKKISPNSEIKFRTMGIEEECFKKIDKKLARKRLKLNLNKKYVLYIGRIKTTKGIKELLDAAEGLKGIEFLLVGGGVEEEILKYENYVKEKNISNVKFLGSVYGKEKLDYLSASDCLILPSYTEGAPVVLMEAMAKNLPVIATNVGGIPIMIKDKEGIIIKPKSGKEIINAIKEILIWKKRDMKKEAEKYKWKEIIEKTIEDYER
ncbi:MAG: glycosyltransferase family 4 protein [Candidatus Nanoarchaeia archaeon]|nr:glycosyltransferase family 4 protein [Candidatus Nanoarchaeia archaeon]MDD5358138.1 glycosyltransferase family 4 protein [Candidatus Nanoarchaeia archaeon]MDD5589325.1 glycosyltransferase family 4 protein [Candidatus Nanoarchaeia archaeon]